MQKLVLATFSISSALFLSGQAQSASFDCGKAATWVEKTICTTPELSKLDEAMAKKYKQNLASAADYEDSKSYKNGVIANQQLWLNFQRNTCKDVKCLIREYKEYLEEATYHDWDDELNHSDLPSKNAFGNFFKNFKISIYNVDGKGKYTLQDATDSLSINSVNDRPNISVVEAELFFDNLHVCGIEESVATWSQNHWVIMDSNGSEEAELRLYPAPYKNKNQLLLKDIGYHFSSGRCGVRGYFDGILLER